MPDRMPASLRRHGISAVTDNRQAGEEVRVGAEVLARYFGAEVKQRLIERRRQQRQEEN